MENKELEKKNTVELEEDMLEDMLEDVSGGKPISLETYQCSKCGSHMVIIDRYYVCTKCNPQV